MLLTNAQIEQRMKSGIQSDISASQSQSAWQEAWNAPAQKATPEEWYLNAAEEKTPSSRKMRLTPILSAAAAVLVICFISAYMLLLRPVASVYMDVNPAIALDINSRNKVISAQGINSDGQRVLNGMKLKGTDVDVAINALLGSMVKNGYLKGDTDAVLISVKCDNIKISARLKARLTAQARESMGTLIGSDAVFDQSVDMNDEVIRLSEEYSISYGRAALIRRVSNATGLPVEDMAGLSLKKLISYLYANGYDLRDYIDFAGSRYEKLIDEIEDELEDIADDDRKNLPAKPSTFGTVYEDDDEDDDVDYPDDIDDLYDDDDDEYDRDDDDYDEHLDDSDIFESDDYDSDFMDD